MQCDAKRSSGVTRQWAGKKLSGLKLRKIVFKITRLLRKILKVLILIKFMGGIGRNQHLHLRFSAIADWFVEVIEAWLLQKPESLQFCFQGLLS
jgi:hypothetical protein